MRKLNYLLVVLCINLALFSQTALSQVSGTTAVNTNDAAAEEKARNFFTDLEVIDQNGNQLRFYSDVLKDRVVLVNFIFTNCKDYCPMVTQKLKHIRSLLVDSVRDDVWFISISIDPERDTPEAMKAFVKKQNLDESRWLFLTGSTQNLEFIARQLGQYSQDVEAHSTLMLAANTKTRHWAKVMPMAQPPGIAQQMRALVEETPG